MARPRKPERPDYGAWDNHSSNETWEEACARSAEWSQTMRVTSVRREALRAWVVVAAFDVIVIAVLVYWLVIA